MKLVDFGLSTVSERVDKVSPSGPAPGEAIGGTPMYMAPETGVRGQGAASAADIFSFGVIAFELLTGNRPFTVPPAQAEPESAPAPALLRQRPDLPAELATLIDRCLLTTPEQRPSAEALAAALANF